MYYIIGLGNPDDAYDGTRHNVGRAAVDALRQRSDFGAWEKNKGANALYTRGEVAGVEAELLLPETFMNRSGETVRYVVEKHNATPADFIVVYDDIDLPLGTVRVSVGRGDGGHNGVKSITAHLGSTAFARVRIGIAPTSFWTGQVKRPAAGGALERFVLGRFSRRERTQADEAIARACTAVERIVADGVEKAMNECNSRA